MIQVIITQCVFTAFTIYISRTQKINRVYIATFIANVVQALMYLSNDDIPTMVSCWFITIRSFIYIFRDRMNYVRAVPWIMIVIQLGLGIITIENPWQIISVLAPCFTCYYMWFFRTTQLLRIGNAICNTAWLIYDIHGSLFIVVVSRGIMVATNVIAYIQHRKDDWVPAVRKNITNKEN